jgi:hypothetical protein
VISSIEREGKFAPLLNKVQLHEDLFGGGEITLSITTLDTKRIKKLITESSSSILYFDWRNGVNENS